MNVRGNVCPAGLRLGRFSELRAVREADRVDARTLNDQISGFLTVKLAGFFDCSYELHLDVCNAREATSVRRIRPLTEEGDKGKSMERARASGVIFNHTRHLAKTISIAFSVATKRGYLVGKPHNGEVCLEWR